MPKRKMSPEDHQWVSDYIDDTMQDAIDHVKNDFQEISDDIKDVFAFIQHSPEERKKIRRRESWQAFLRGLGGVGAGMYTIGEGMSRISIIQPNHRDRE